MCDNGCLITNRRGFPPGEKPIDITSGLDLGKDGVQILKHLLVGKAKDAKTTRAHGVIADEVESGLIGGRVVGAVEFDHEAGFRAIEVNDPTEDDGLGTKAEPGFIIAEAGPEDAFGGGRAGAEFFS